MQEIRTLAEQVIRLECDDEVKLSLLKEGSTFKFGPGHSANLQKMQAVL